MKSYYLFDYDHMSDLQAEVLDYLQVHTQLLESAPHPWNNLDLRGVLDHSPSLVKFLRSEKLLPRAAFAVIASEEICVHQDTPPVIAKMIFPIYNTQHWVNRWYHIPEEVCESVPVKTQHGLGLSGVGARDFRRLDLSEYHCDEIVALNQPCVLNSSRPHGVFPLDPGYVPQRVLLSLTLHNEPLDLLKF